jgi:hypothetical protein
MKKIRLIRNFAMLIMTMLLCNYTFSQEKTYKIGDLYESGDIKGVVFVVNEVGTHGKIISINETSAPWIAFMGASYIQVGIDKNEVDGSKNMRIIMNSSGWQETYTAANWCFKHGEKWYLPSATELIQIFQNRDILNETLASIEESDEVFPLKRKDVYYSSNELSHVAARTVSSKGKLQWKEKRYPARVRAVCKF